MYYIVMKILSSSPYATFNLKEWNSLVSKSGKFVNTPIKVQKNYLRTLDIKKIGSTKILSKKNELHKQMQLIFA